MFLVGWNELANSDNHRVAVALVAWVSHPNQTAALVQFALSSLAPYKLTCHIRSAAGSHQPIIRP